MSKATQSITLNHTSDANFRVWGLQVRAALTAAGLTNTSDTGQANWTTIVRAAVDTDGGYEIWRMSDTHQATRPLFIKVRYGTSSVADRIRLRIDVGEGSDGVGNLTGAVKTNFSIFEMNNSTVGTVDLNVNYNATLGYLGIATSNLASASVAFTMLSMERLKDATGAATNRGFAVAWGDTFSSTLTSCGYSTFASAWSTEPGSGSLPAFWPTQAAGVASAGGTYIAGLTPNTGNGTHGVLERTLCMCVCGYGDFSLGEQFAITRWDGNSHTYLAVGSWGAAQSNSSSQGAYARHAMLWE